MSRPDWRNLPPVEPVNPPERLSQTLLKHAKLPLTDAAGAYCSRVCQLQAEHARNIAAAGS